MIGDVLQDRALVYLFYCGIMLGVLLAFSALAGALRRGETRAEARSRRLRMVAEGSTVEERLAVLKPPPVRTGFARVPVLGAVPAALKRAGVPLSAPAFFGLCALLAGVTLVILTPMVGGGGAALVALASGLGLPLVALRIRLRKQADALVAQLPDALELMARGLRVGHPLNASIGAVAQEMADPIGTEFGIVFDQVNYGDDLPEAFQDFADRVDLEDVHYLSASIGIQHGSGGDLARVIEVLARVIRGRAALRRKIKAISSEGRASAAFLSALPFIMFGFTSVSSPNYYGGVMDDPLFTPMAAAVVGLTLVNALVLQKLVNFHV